MRFNRAQNLFNILIFMCCIFSSRMIGAEQNLRAEINLNKNIYLLREPIWVTPSTKNVGTKVERFYYGKYMGGMMVRNSGGNFVGYHGPFESNVHKAQPGSTYKYSFDILLYYGVPEDKWPVRFYMPLGEYTIQAIHYLNEWKDKEQKKRKEFLSNEIKFRVIEPKGKEAEAHKLLKQAYDTGLNKDAINKYEKLLHLYPNSVYAPMALDWIIAIKVVCFHNHREGIEDCKRLIEKYSDSDYAPKAVGRIVVALCNLGEHERIKTEMEKIADRYKGTKIVEKAKEIIRKWEAGRYRPPKRRP